MGSEMCIRDSYTIEPERRPDTPQDTVWEDLPDAPQDVVRADVLDTSMGGMLEAVPSNDAPERTADTMPDDVPDATEEMCQGGKQTLRRMAHRTMIRTLQRGTCQMR